MRLVSRPALLVLLLSGATFFSGCAHQANAGVYASRDAYGDRFGGDHWRGDRGRPGELRSGVGTIVSIAESDRDASSNPEVGAGAVLGGAVGAVIGRRVGSSVEAKNAGTVIGAVLGAVAGHQIERARSKRDAIRVTVRLDNGRLVTLDQERSEDLRVGDRVQIQDSRITRLGRRGPRELESWSS